MVEWGKNLKRLVGDVEISHTFEFNGFPLDPTLFDDLQEVETFWYLAHRYMLACDNKARFGRMLFYAERYRSSEWFPYWNNYRTYIARKDHEGHLKLLEENGMKGSPEWEHIRELRYKQIRREVAKKKEREARERERRLTARKEKGGPKVPRAGGRPSLVELVNKKWVAKADPLGPSFFRKKNANTYARWLANESDTSPNLPDSILDLITADGKPDGRKKSS